MKIENFFDIIHADFFSGVPDSQLKSLCDYLIYIYGDDPKHHVIAANEGNAVAIAAGYYYSTGKVPAIYMQNSGIGNTINPFATLFNKKVYPFPCLIIIGWRGEPGIVDEPQHRFQGQITVPLLDTLDIPYEIIRNSTSLEEFGLMMNHLKKDMSHGSQAALVVGKGALDYDGKVQYDNDGIISREEAIERILLYCGSDFVVSTTGKASRELYELRGDQKHNNDFLTVGAMGHCSSIALGVALQVPNKKVWCIDGDGSAIMHMGAFAVIGECCPKNLVHIIINNEAHESVGGQPTAMRNVNICGIAKNCGYSNTFSVSTLNELDKALKEILKSEGLFLVEIKCRIGARGNLGRPNLYVPSFHA